MNLLAIKFNWHNNVEIIKFHFGNLYTYMDVLKCGFQYALRFTIKDSQNCCIKVQYSQVHFSYNTYFEIFTNNNKLTSYVRNSQLKRCLMHVSSMQISGSSLDLCFERIMSLLQFYPGDMHGLLLC